MLEAIRRAISFLRQKQILHKLGVVVSVTVIGIACYVLYHMLRGIDVEEVIEALKQTEPRQIGLAALFVAAGYFTLTFYDLFAVRAIGRTECGDRDLHRVARPRRERRARRRRSVPGQGAERRRGARDRDRSCAAPPAHW